MKVSYLLFLYFQHCDQQRRLQGAHQAAEDSRGHLQQHPDCPAAQTLSASLRVLRLRVTQKHELLCAQQHAGLQHHHRGSGAGTPAVLSIPNRRDHTVGRQLLTVAVHYVLAPLKRVRCWAEVLFVWSQQT